MARKHSTKTSSQPIGEGFKFIDLFAGIGGFHQALHNLGAECVFASERDEAARTTYRHNFMRKSPHLFEHEDRYFNRDITEVTQSGLSGLSKGLREAEIRKRIPEFHVLCGGFPCQPFSQAGFKRGFEDERGNLFFDIMRILDSHQPDALFLENVRHLLKHDGMRTIREIRKQLKRSYGTILEFEVRASDHGLPQHRPRVFLIGFHNRVSGARDYFSSNAPTGRDLEPRSLARILGGTVMMPDGKTERRIGYTLRVGGRQSPILDRRNWDGYIVNGREHRLTPRQGLKMQGFNDDFEFPRSVSSADQMKQLGNSVAVPAVQDYAHVIFEALRVSSG